MIPQKELDQLVQYYKGELTEHALLNKAGNLAAQTHVLLSNPKLPASIVKAKTKPISRELTKLTRRLRQFPGGAGAPGGAPGDDDERDDDEDEGGLVTGPVEQWLKRMIKGTPSTPKAHKTATGSIKKKGQPSTSGRRFPFQKEQDRHPVDRSGRRRSRSTFGSSARTPENPRRKISRQWFLGQRQRQRLRQRQRQRQRTLGLGTLKTAIGLGRLGARQKVSTPFGIRFSMRKKKQPQRKTSTRRTRRKRPAQRGRGVDIQNRHRISLACYQFMGPGTHLEKRLKRGVKGINRLDRIAKQHDIYYNHAKNLQDK